MSEIFGYSCAFGSFIGAFLFSITFGNPDFGFSFGVLFMAVMNSVMIRVSK